jgi:hypothetical protein
MVAVGFASNKLYGSVWSFQPVRDELKALSERKINIHELHLDGKLSFADSRRIGRRMMRAYGLDGSSFFLGDLSLILGLYWMRDYNFVHHQVTIAVISSMQKAVV